MATARPLGRAVSPSEYFAGRAPSIPWTTTCTRPDTLLSWRIAWISVSFDHELVLLRARPHCKTLDTQPLHAVGR